MGHRRRLWIALLLSLIPGMVGILLSIWPPAASLENKGLDFLFLLRGPRETPPGVCVVSIDDDSYELLHVGRGQLWPRGKHAELIRTLESEGARAVAFDCIFGSERDAEQDRAFEDALRETGIVVLGRDVQLTVDPRYSEITIRNPIEKFATAAAAVADVGVSKGRDGVVRQIRLVREGRLSLALATVQFATRRTLPEETNDRIIDYYGEARRVSTVSLYQAMRPREYLPQGFFKDKVVFVGSGTHVATGAAAIDTFLTPFRSARSPETYGVEIHATVAANLLEGRHIDLLSTGWEAALFLLLPLIACTIFLYLRPLAGIFVLLGLELLPWIAGYLAFTHANLWLPVMIPSLIQLPLAYVVGLLWFYLTTVREREWIRKAFSFYLSPGMIEKIMADPDSLNLGGEEIDGTALFTDIKGFTAIASTMRATETVAMLNAYLTQVSERILGNGGTLIKFIGDAAFAIWGAPVHSPDHAARACAAALALSQAQKAGPGEEDSPITRLTTRIGVHSGPMVVGNVGSGKRFDYTAIGDAVNVSSRLEGLNKYFGTRAIASGDALSRTDGQFITRRLGRVRVVGKDEPLEVFELVGRPQEQTRPDGPALARFEQALSDFSARRFGEAKAGFLAVRTMCGGDDGPSEFYLHTIDTYEREAPPPADWDGVVNFESK